MPFLFFDVDYKFKTRWGGARRDIGVEILRKSTLNRWTAIETIRQLRASGLGYRKTEMLDDIRLAKTQEMSKTRDAYERAKSHHNMMERLRALVPGQTLREAKAFREKWRLGTIRTLEEADLAGTMEGEGFDPGDTP